MNNHMIFIIKMNEFEAGHTVNPLSLYELFKVKHPALVHKGLFAEGWCLSNL